MNENPPENPPEGQLENQPELAELAEITEKVEQAEIKGEKSQNESTSEKPEEKVDIPEMTEEEKEKAKKEFMQETFDKNTFISEEIFNKSKTFQAPFPKRLTKEQLITKYNPDYLKDFLIKDYYGVYCLNQEIVDRQSGVIKDLIVQLTKSILSRT